MIIDFYNLREQPFGVTPDPRFLYMSAGHREALASLLHGTQARRGFMSLLAHPGMGKTTILFQLLSQLKDSTRTSYLFQTFGQPEDLLHALLLDLGVTEHSGSMVGMQEQLNRVLWDEASRGRTVVVVIDEAQNLNDSTLELVRMLSNFETTSDKLVQIVLAGQLQLREKLASAQLVQLRQRVSIRAHLSPFHGDDTHAYIERRLRVAGYDFQNPLFTPEAEALIAKYSEGIPRNINNICFNALSLGCVLKQRTIEKNVIREVLDDLELEPRADEVSGMRWIEWKATKLKTELQALTWRSSIALLATLLVPLLWVVVRSHSQRPAPALSAVATPRTLLEDAGQPVSKDVEIDSKSDTTSNGQLQTGEPLTPKPIRQITVRSDSQSGSKTNVRPGTTRAQTPDPSTLWNKVKKGRSDAEVELARIYLEGIGVEQNCMQARVLLQDASRKGNTHAADLLADSASLCH
ncbi:MAG: AAA family ATPase [Candidatus Sulfotelmatobacter sp.]